MLVVWERPSYQSEGWQSTRRAQYRKSLLEMKCLIGECVCGITFLKETAIEENHICGITFLKETAIGENHMRQWFLILETIDRIRQGQRDQRGRDQIIVHKMWRFALYSSNHRHGCPRRPYVHVDQGVPFTRTTHGP